MLRRTFRRFTPSTGVLGGVGRLNHVAIAVPATRTLDAAASMYRTLFNATISAPMAIPEHGVTTVFVEFENTKIELLHPLGDKSPIAKFLAQNPEGGVHHVCVEVDDMDAAITKVKALGIRPLAEKPRIGAHGKLVMFLHPKDCGGVLVEMELK